MGLFLYGILVVAGLLLVYLVFAYLDLRELRQGISTCRAEIDHLVQQRHKVLPDLLRICKERYQCEELCEGLEQAMQQVYQLHNHSLIQKFGDAESVLRQQLGEFFHLLENQDAIPDQSQFRDFYRRIMKLQIKIAERREHYNDLVATNNQKIRRFPERLLAKKLDLQALESLDFHEETLPGLEISGIFAV